MKSGILRPDEGYDILHNGVHRTFRDVKEVAFALRAMASRCIQKKSSKSATVRP
jgi:hypothetical protein